MRNSALFEAIESLTPIEIRAVRRWLNSPAFTTRTEPCLLFDYCIDCFTQKLIPDPKDIAALLNTKDDKRIRREMSELLDLLLGYFAWQELQKDPARRECYQLRAVSRRGLGKNFNLALREAEKAKFMVGEATLSRQFIDFQINIEKYRWEIGRHRVHVFPFESLSNSLNAWYAGQLLQLACMEQAQNAVHRSIQADPANWVEHVVRQLPGAPHQHLPAVAIYHLGYQMLAHPDNHGYEVAFRELLAAHISTLPIDEARGLLMMAINHGIRSINAGEKAAIQSTLAYYRIGLDKRLLHDDSGILSKYTYNNVLMAYLALEDWENAKIFLEQYLPDLAASERENIYHYNLAVFHFRRGDFDSCLSLLRSVGFADPMYNLESRKMLLKIYYEQSAYDALQSLLENLLTWLRRHGELGYHREMYRNLAVFTGRLIRLRPNDTEGRKRLKKKIQDTPLVAERGWLLGKM